MPSNNCKNVAGRIRRGGGACPQPAVSVQEDRRTAGQEDRRTGGQEDRRTAGMKYENDSVGEKTIGLSFSAKY